MINSKALQKTNNLLSAAFTAGALVMLFSAGKIMAYPNVTELELTTVAATTTLAQCSKALTTLGVSNVATQDSVVVEEATQRRLPELIERGSLAAQSCPGLVLTEFCAGDACLPSRGLRLSLAVAGPGA